MKALKDLIKALELSDSFKALSLLRTCNKRSLAGGFLQPVGPRGFRGTREEAREIVFWMSFGLEEAFGGPGKVFVNERLCIFKGVKTRH